MPAWHDWIFVGSVKEPNWNLCQIMHTASVHVLSSSELRNLTQMLSASPDTDTSFLDIVERLDRDNRPRRQILQSALSRWRCRIGDVPSWSLGVVSFKTWRCSRNPYEIRIWLWNKSKHRNFNLSSLQQKRWKLGQFEPSPASHQADLGESDFKISL